MLLTPFSINYCIYHYIKNKTRNYISFYQSFLFYNCFSLQQISIPSVTKIGCFSFYGCSSLLKILINSSIKEIGDFSFSGCDLLSQSLLPFPLKTNKLLIQNNKKRNDKNIFMTKKIFI